ncbi:hypothetical protein BsWGS_07385 [Bradybaena similaris]
MTMHQEYKISGVSVLFPCKPYPSQFSMMDKIIKGIQRRQNCLIESPTGSGKSLALLCSALAWQSAEKAKQELGETEETETHVCTCAHAKVNGSSPVKATPVEGTQLSELSNVAEHDDDDDFKPAEKTANPQKPQRDHKKHIVVVYDSDEDVAAKKPLEEEQPDVNKPPQSVCVCNCTGGAERKPRAKIPKIYFGTRTHKQVAQIVRELRKTGYHDVRMTVLGSREHTCIHPQVSRTKNKNEACKELLNDYGCHFKDATSRLSSQNIVKGLGLSTAWDLEDLVTFSKTKKACPYFLSRALKEDSDLIICPYNYLVDPMVREAMQISLKGHVVILDEAHNIEDSAREAASQSLTQDSILKAMWDIESLMNANINLADHSKLRSMLKNLDIFINTNKSQLEQKEYDRSYKIWTGFHIVAQLETLGLGPHQFPEYKSALASVKSDAEVEKEIAARSRRSKELVEMKPSTQTVLEQMFQILDYLYRLDLKYVDDYRASLCQMYNYVPVTSDNQWLNAKSAYGGRSQVQVDVYTLNFWCMNPGVAFSDFSETRSIILTSGTLSPMSSFQSELGLEFKIQLETNHVIEDSQVWVGTLGRGPSGSTLQAVFRNLETFTFQDELGHLVLKVCQIVPHGVLCFLPSYNVLDKLMNRWESTGLKRKLEQCKLVIREPKNSDKLNFEDQLQKFYDALTPQSDCVGETDTDGAIFFAVCRGKVSEGLDFADNFARAVITVGVPYPNFKDVQVELKRKYNDQYRQSRGLLSGSEWYEIQAFRALNQALGRCIRHRHDWGALIIVDDRFVRTSEKYCKGLSKWLRNKIHTYQDCSVAMESLSKFTAGQLAAMDSRASLDASLLKSPEIKLSPKLPAELKTIISSPMIMSPDLYDTDMMASKQVIVETGTPAKPFPIFNMGSFVRARASPVNTRGKQPTIANSTGRLTQHHSSVSLEDVSTDSGISLSQPKQTNNSLTDSLFHAKNLAHNTDSLTCGIDSLACGIVSLAHNIASLADDTDVTKDQVVLKDSVHIAVTTHSLPSTSSNAQPSDSTTVAPASAVSLQTQAESPNKLPLHSPTPNWQSAGVTPDTHSRPSLMTGTRPAFSNKKYLFRRSCASDITTNNLASKDKSMPLTASLTVSKDESIPSRISIPVSQKKSIPSTNSFTPVSKDKSIPRNTPTPVSIDKLIPPTNTSTPVSKEKSISPTNASTPVSKGKSIPTNASTPVSKDKSIPATRCSPNPSPLKSKNSHPQSPADCNKKSQPDGEDRLHVRRKNRGTKRKHMSRSGLENTVKVEESTTCQTQAKIVIVCSVCDCLLVHGIDKSDFQEQRSVPSFLRESDSSCTSGSIFFPGNTSCGPLHDIKGCMEGVYSKYNEQEEICVQFLFCGQCLKASPHNSRPVGAEVKLAAGSGARFSKGQMWLFLGAITQRQEQ